MCSFSAFGNNTIFLQQFFRFRGGGERSLCSPLATPMALVQEQLRGFSLSRQIRMEDIEHPLNGKRILVEK